MVVDGKYVPYAVSHAVRNGRVIEAIKEWRVVSGEGIALAKTFIENNWTALGGSPSHFANKPKTEAPKMADSSAPLPKQELLLKMLNMTTADNDGQALVAIRKANALLASSGWTWEKLLLGKIVVVADPFANIKSPDSSKKSASSGSAPPPRPQPAAPNAGWGSSPPPFKRPTPTPPPPPKPQPAAPKTLGQKANIYPGFCYNCGTHVPSGDGFVFNPSHHAVGALDKWVITCKADNTGIVYVARSAAPKKNNSWTATPTPNGPAPKLGDL